MSTVLSVGLAEGGLRLYFYGSLGSPVTKGRELVRVPDPVLGWHLKPGSMAFFRTLDFVQVERINSHGLRDEEREYDLSPDVYRILILGDSFMEAYQVALEETLTGQLREKLKDRKIEIINLGVTGYGVAQYYLTLREKGLKYKPDLVVMAFFPENDVRNDCVEFERILFGKDSYAEARPHPRWNADGTLGFSYENYDKIVRQWNKRAQNRAAKEVSGRRFYQQTLLYALVTHGRTGEEVQKRDTNIQLGVYRTSFDQAASSGADPLWYVQAWKEAWKKTDTLLGMTCELARENNAKFLIMAVPAQIQGDPRFLERLKKQAPGVDLDIEKPNRHLQEVANKLGCPFLDLVPSFRKHYADGGAPLFFKYGDRHWNKEGHKLAAEALAAFLDQNHLIPPSDPQ